MPKLVRNSRNEVCYRYGRVEALVKNVLYMSLGGVLFGAALGWMILALSTNLLYEFTDRVSWTIALLLPPFIFIGLGIESWMRAHRIKYHNESEEEIVEARNNIDDFWDM